MKTTKTFQAITLSTLLLVSTTGAAIAQDRLVSARCEPGKQISHRVQGPAAETLSGWGMKIERCGGVILFSGNLNLKRFIKNLRAAEGLLGENSPVISPAQ